MKSKFVGGDGNEQFSTTYDAEIYSQYKSLSVYPNENGGGRDRYQNNTAFNRWLVIKIQSAGMAAYSGTGLNHKAYSLNLLQFGDAAGSHEAIWYLGIDRVVGPYDKSYAEGNRWRRVVLLCAFDGRRDRTWTHQSRYPPYLTQATAHPLLQNRLKIAWNLVAVKFAVSGHWSYVQSKFLR